MQHYWGAVEIAKRIGLRNRGAVRQWITKYGLPAYPRRRPNRAHTCLYASEAMIAAWELSRAKTYREQTLRQDKDREKHPTYSMA